MSEPLTQASERLIRDWDLHPDAIDASELAARLWLIEREAARRAESRNAALDDVERAVGNVPEADCHALAARLTENQP